MQTLDGTLIEDSIGSASLCADCIVRRTGLPSSRLNDALPRLIGALRVSSILAACGICLRQRVVHRREADAAREPRRSPWNGRTMSIRLIAAEAQGEI